MVLIRASLLCFLLSGALALISPHDLLLKRPLTESLSAVQKPVGEGESNDVGILHGQKTDIAHHPYQAAVIYGKTVFASGAILNKNYVLTVGIFPYYAQYISVAVGQSKISKMVHTVPVEKIILHPDNSLGTDYGISLLKLKQPLKFSKTVKPIGVSDSAPESGSSAVVSGWGFIDQNFTQVDDLLQLKQTVLTREECKPYYLSSTVSNTTVCAYKSEEQRPTVYDGGDPLVQNKKLIGIYLADFASPVVCNDMTKCPSIYTDAVQLRDWIVHTISQE